MRHIDFGTGPRELGSRFTNDHQSNQLDNWMNDLWNPIMLAGFLFAVCCWASFSAAFLFFYFPSLVFFFFFVIFCLVQVHCCYFFGPFVSIGNMKRAQTIQISPASSSKSNKSEHIYCNHKYNWSERNTYYRKYELKFVGRQKEVMLTDCYA